MILIAKQFIKVYICVPEVYSEPSQLSKMKCFAKIGNALQLLTIFGKCSILVV